MSIKERIQILIQLGNHLQDILESQNAEWEAHFLQAFQQNPWFTPENSKYALEGIMEMLNPDQLETWVEPYWAKLENPGSEKTIGVVMAGNIPFVGFHDLLCTLISGHKLQAKLSSQDTILLPALVGEIQKISPKLANQVHFTNRLKDFDAVIATGSNNTSRYFEYYFQSVPHIIRKNRNSVAILDQTETEEELKSLGNDIFRYFGLGCRNVTSLFIPRDYDLNIFFNSIYSWRDIINHNKYANNYDYHKALWLLNQDQLIENGFIMLKEDEKIASPVGSLFYTYYDSTTDLEKMLEERKQEIQCIVSHHHTPFGDAQKPKVWDYADGIDTLEFLLK